MSDAGARRRHGHAETGTDPRRRLRRAWSPASWSSSTAAGELQVVRQNLETSSAEALDAKGRAVSLEWRPEHQLEIDNPGKRKERR
jgi:hypothetical protein